MRLIESARTYKSLSFIGMCKNAGKTTALNRFIAEEKRVLGVTSVGRDGESIDLVTKTPKPLVYTKKGTLVATARTLLKDCTATRQLLAATGIGTALGEVIAFRAVSDGYIELAGPSTVSGLAAVGETLEKLGAEMVLFDGALSRKSLCSKRVAQAVLLSTGASYDRDMNRVAADTATAVRLLTLKEAAISPSGKGNAEAFKNGFPLGDFSDAAADRFKAGADELYLPGALTDRTLIPLLKSGADLCDRIIVVDDPGKILVSYATAEAYMYRGGRLEALNSINLLGVTLNPVSAYGYAFDKRAFRSALEEKLTVPVYDVMED